MKYLLTLLFTALACLTFKLQIQAQYFAIEDYPNIKSKIEKLYWSQEQQDQGVVGNEDKLSYDKDGNLTEWVKIYYGEISAKWVYVNNGGKCIEEIRYNPNGSIYSIDEYKYDISGNLVENVTKHTDGIFFKKTYTYDQKGNKLKYFFNGELSGTYTYNSLNQLIKETIVNYWTKTFDIYDSNGNILQQTKYNSDASLYSYSVCEYDDNNNLIISTGKDIDGEIMFTTKYYYDDFGFTIRTTKYDSNNKIVSDIKYTTTYDKNDHLISNNKEHFPLRFSCIYFT